MSGSMFLGRVVLPGIGLAITVLLGWKVLRSEANGVSAPMSPSSLGSALDPASATRLSAIEIRRRADASPVILAEGHVVPCPGAEALIGAEMTGTVARVLVNEKASVHKGDLLVELRGDEIRAAAEEAVAHVSEIDAELAQLAQEQKRLDRDRDRDAQWTEAKEQLDARRNATRARRAAAVAAYRRIEAEFARTRLRAPIDGVVVSRSVNPGETVVLGTPLLRLVDLSRLRIEAELDEYDIPRCQPGHSAKITASGYMGQSWPGTVEELAEHVTPRRLRPEDPGRPSDTRILPVRIAFDAPTPLKLGQRVEVEVAESSGDATGAKLTEAPPITERR
jgi:RND family efflux transporter MFP subunit